MIVFLFIVLLLCSIASSALFTFHSGFKANHTGLLLKSIAGTFFVLLGFFCCRASGKAVEAVVVGLAFCLIGDIFLNLKLIYKKDDPFFTAMGMGAFMLGHLFYIGYQFSYFGLYGPGLWISLIIAACVALFIYFLSERLMHANYGMFRGLSAVYAGVVFFLTVYSFFNAFFHGITGSKVIFFLGALIFLISDLILSQIYFGEDKDTPKNRMLNHGLYYLGQILIAISLFML